MAFLTYTPSERELRECFIGLQQALALSLHCSTLSIYYRFEFLFIVLNITFMVAQMTAMYVITGTYACY
ncbi:hypothetical protein PILCRDRAFT_818958 [Piloderma croceum F 1598]|uniref:Uncharacterized protein n=1 Tax=Piloderma croceum (strain F 1598) TaxID=765440 RepID=A0A0C3G058_PILCF|nr:hypothetical protein PILCRDRAFT_818958 [Piloderma croceum F 1598]